MERGREAEAWMGSSAPCLTPWHTQVADCQNHTMEKVAISRLILYLTTKRQSSGFSNPALSWNIVLWLHEAINQLSTNFALVPPLTLQHWWCRAALNIPHLLIFLGTARIQSTELNYLASMICNSHLL